MLPLDQKKVVLISPDNQLADRLQLLLSEKGNALLFHFSEIQKALFFIYNSPPDMILIHFDNFEAESYSFTRTLKMDNIFGHLPIVLFLNPESSLFSLELCEEAIFDDYCILPFTDKDLLIRLNLVLQRSYRELDANPLTRLPGNSSIIKDLDRRIADQEKFAVCYGDLDFFKAFNDKYGFARGDEVIRLIARLIVNAVQSLNDPTTFVGHVGGDDFVFIVPPDKIEHVCSQVCSNLDLIVPSLYDSEDRAQGFIISKDRKGETQKFPMVAISIAIVTNVQRTIEHSGQISSIVASLKKVAKKKDGSVFVIDRRRD